MVQIYSLSIILIDQTKPIVVSFHHENNKWYSFLYKDTLKEFSTFFSKLIAEKTPCGSRQKVFKNDYTGYSIHRYDGICAVLITDKDYPERVAFDIARIIANQFSTDYPTNSSINISQYTAFNNKIKDIIQKYQDPTNGDKILKIKNDIDETKDVIMKLFDKLFDRQETLESLIDKTNDLSIESKLFYRKSKKTCCNY